MARKKFNTEFKDMIINLLNSGKGPTELSREYGISVASIYQWAEQRKVVTKSDDKEITTSDVVEYQKEIARLKEENEILKKAMAIFVKPK